MIKRYAYQGAVNATGGTATRFTGNTNISGDATFDQETVNIAGAAGSVVSFQLTSVINSNTAGQIFCQNALVFINNTFTVTLDGSGNGSFPVKVQGDASQTGTIVKATFTITGTSLGVLGSPLNVQISKVF